MPQKRRQRVSEPKEIPQSRSRSRRLLKEEPKPTEKNPDMVRILTKNEQMDMKALIAKKKQEKLLREQELKKQQDQMEVEKILEEMQLFQPDLPLE